MSPFRELGELRGIQARELVQILVREGVPPQVQIVARVKDPPESRLVVVLLARVHAPQDRPAGAPILS